jgi:hypothetical protein
MALNGVGKNSVKLGVVRVSKNLKASLFRKLRTPGTEQEQKNAAWQIAKEEREFARAFDRTEEYWMASALQGSIAAQVGDVTISAINYGIPAGNQFAHNHGTPALNCGDWRDESTDLHEAIERIKDAARQATGYELTRAYVSGSMKASMLKSESFRDFVDGSPTGEAAAKEGSLGRFSGLNWFAVDHSYKVGSTVTRYLAKNKVIFTPEPDGEWAFMRYGSLEVPADDDEGFNEVLGRSSYAMMQKDPPALTLVAGLAALPVIPKPGAIVLATVSAA